MQIGQRVDTKFGTGTVAGFERAATGITRPSEYAPGDRVEVALDDPKRWVISNLLVGNPYFYANEINQLTKE